MTKDEALKLALEALTHLQPNALTIFYTIGNRDKAIKAIREALSQPEQEPVAWMGAHDHTDLYYRKPPQVDVVPLYTTPPQRTWVGLTQQDIDIAFDDTQEGGGFDDFARAIEAKLKEKNT